MRGSPLGCLCTNLSIRLIPKSCSEPQWPRVCGKFVLFWMSGWNIGSWVSRPLFSKRLFISSLCQFFNWACFLQHFLYILLLLLLSHSAKSDSLWPHGLQHARLPHPSPSPEFTQTHVHWVSDAIQPSRSLLSPSPPTFNISQHQGLFQ